MLKEYLEVTEMLNFRSQEIQKLVVKKHWSNLTEPELFTTLPRMLLKAT